MFDPKTFTYGFEMEVGDVPRALMIPSHLGEWEHSERDIVNEREPYRGMCSDPDGINPPVGGEINTKPTLGWPAQVKRILDIKEFCVLSGHMPTSPFTTHNHLHVHVPGLIEDIGALRQLMAYIGDNQQTMVDRAYQFYDLPTMKLVPKIKTYLQHDGGRMFHPWQIKNIMSATNFYDFIREHRRNQRGTVLDRVLRNAINTYCLKFVKTVEFRCFRASFEESKLESCFKVVEAFMDNALNHPERSMNEFFNETELDLPMMTFDLELARGWAATKVPDLNDNMGTRKNRTYYEVEQ
jgi:hypothetical protein